MCVCVCVCVCVCMCVCVCVCDPLLLSVSLFLSLSHSNSHTHTHARTHARTQAHTHTHTHTHTQAPAGAHRVGGGVRLQLSSPLGENQCCPGGHPLPYHAAGHLCGWASSRVSEERHKALHSRECRRNIRRSHQRGPPLDEGRQLPWHHRWAAASSPQPRQSPPAGNANRRALNGDRQPEAAAPTPEPLQSLTQPGQRGWSTTWQKACDQWPTHPWILVVPTTWPRWSSMPVQAAVPAATAWPARRTATGKLLTPVASIRRATGGRNTTGLIGKCPTTTILMSGHEVAALLDTGSEVTTVTETWAAAHLQDRSLQQAFLTLRAVNGAEVPYSGILLVDIDILGKRCPDVPVLVVREPTELSLQQRKRRLPVLVGWTSSVHVSLRSQLQPARSPRVFRLSSARFDCSSEQPPRASRGPHLAATFQPTPWPPSEWQTDRNLPVTSWLHPWLNLCPVGCWWCQPSSAATHTAASSELPTCRMKMSCCRPGHQWLSFKP